ncbi:ureidoglycolate hydrolase [Podospora didyma]|uniref:Ureidoglycolate hydrolase n=1 Tax=Podospora didyma TaxID=330526 RepID=A0AAE0U8F6_9PEZI|nr:ureidoglycolate hydrolase [Podospora didyma]
MAKQLAILHHGADIVVDAAPLDREAFVHFGDVIENPRPDLHPSAANRLASVGQASLPLDGLVANQGSAIKYQHPTRMANFYDQAPSGRPGVAVVNMFVCAGRADIRSSERPVTFPISVLERHPFTTQTFIPLTADPFKQYLVVVAPTLPPANADQALPVPAPGQADSASGRRLPGRGLPDLSRLRAFIANAKQAVTYSAGTWHAPMVALGSAGIAVDFLVVQFANGVGIEDCQEVVLDSAAGGRITARLRAPRPAKI